MPIWSNFILDSVLMDLFNIAHVLTVEICFRNIPIQFNFFFKLFIAFLKWASSKQIWLLSVEQWICTVFFYYNKLYGVCVFFVRNKSYSGPRQCHEWRTYASVPSICTWHLIKHCFGLNFKKKKQFIVVKIIIVIL